MSPAPGRSGRELALVGANLSLTDDGLTIRKPRNEPLGRVASTLRISKAPLSSLTTIPYLHILSASASTSPSGATLVSIHAVKSHSNQRSSKLWKLEGELQAGTGGDDSVKAREWVAELELLAYGGEKPVPRRLLVLVNPIGGRGQAKLAWEGVVRPIFEAAGCHVTLQYTGAPGSPTNSTNLAKELDLSAHDALVTVSGDGIVHELLNGLASREDAIAALRMPIVPIPAGSGNALNVNLHGPKRATVRAWAALNAVKGSVIPLDLCSVTQGGKRFYSFLSQAFGLMSQIDLGTEDMRWLGDTRFTLGYVQGSLTKAVFPMEITLKVVESDKLKMMADYNEALEGRTRPALDELLASDSDMRIPALRFGTSDEPLPNDCTVHDDVPMHLEPGWHTLKAASIFFLYAGLLPYVAKDVKMFPCASGDGLLDVVVVNARSRIDSLLAMDGADKGKILWNSDLRYYKVECYRLNPLSPSGYISIDGESVPHTPLQVETHSRLARTISLSGGMFGEPIVQM